MNPRKSELTDQDISNRVHRALSATPISADTRQHIWEDLMHSATVSTPGITTTTSASTDTPRHATPTRGGFTETRLARAVVRWQAAVSLAVVVAVLVSLMGVAWQRGILDGPPPTPEGQFPALAQEGTPDDVADLLPDCVAQENTSRSNEELLAAEFLDFSVPNYSSASAWPLEETPELYDVTQQFWTCLSRARAIDSTIDPSDPVYSYLSERLRYILMVDQLPEDQRVAVDTYTARNPIQTIINNYPLPLNSFTGNVYFPTEPDIMFTYGLFGDRDLYLLPNDRWATTMGSVSTNMLQTGEPVRSGDGQLTFVTFVQEGDAWMIDEFFLVCPSDFAASLTEDPDYGPFDPAELIRNPSLTCS